MPSARQLGSDWRRPRRRRRPRLAPRAPPPGPEPAAERAASPASSPCAMTARPRAGWTLPTRSARRSLVRPDSSRNSIPNTRAKFCPSSWLVPICSALPSRIIASHVQLGSAPGKRSAVGLAARQDGDGHHLLHEVLVDLVQHSEREVPGLVPGGVGGVALLPQELGGAQEHPRPQLPAHDVRPLVEQHRQVPVALDPLGEVGVDDGLGGGPYHHRLVELLAPAVGHDGELGAEALEVLGLPAQVGLGDEQREVGVGARPWP